MRVHVLREGYLLVLVSTPILVFIVSLGETLVVNFGLRLLLFGKVVLALQLLFHRVFNNMVCEEILLLLHSPLSMDVGVGLL